MKIVYFNGDLIKERIFFFLTAFFSDNPVTSTNGNTEQQVFRDNNTSIFKCYFFLC